MGRNTYIFTKAGFKGHAKLKLMESIGQTNIYLFGLREIENVDYTYVSTHKIAMSIDCNLYVKHICIK